MAYPVPETWNVSGILSDNGVPFTSGKVEAYNRLQNGALEWMAECGIGSDGSFSLVFSSYMFQKGDESIDHPDLVVRLFDLAGNLLWESDTCAATETPFELGNIDISTTSANDTWSVEGIVYYNTAGPFCKGTVLVYDIWNGQPTLLSKASLNTKGYFSCTYLKSAFQKQGETRSSPNLRIIVLNLQGQSLTTYDVPSPASVHQVVQISLGAVPDVLTNDACKVYGIVKNSLGYPLQTDLCVAAFCLYYKESIDENSGKKSGSFIKKMLGVPVMPDEFGRYEIIYNATDIPEGLKLDGKVPSGKDKASIFSEIRYGSSDNPERFFSSPIVFNGQSVQEINFVLDLESDRPLKPEFIGLDESLHVYYETVIGDNAPTVKKNEQDKIAEFLETVTRLPLVIGREGLEEKNVRAYFKAFQLAHELNHEEIIGPDDLFNCAQYLYPMILNSGVLDLSSLLSLGLDECSRVISSAVGKGLVSSSLNVSEFKTLVWSGLQTSLSVALGEENLFSAFSVFYLFLTKELNLDATLCRPFFSRITAGTNYSQEIFERHQALLKAFTHVGCNYYELIESLKNEQEEDISFSSSEVADLRFLVEVCEFCNWYSDLAVSVYTIAKSITPPVTSLRELLPHGELGFWDGVIGATEARYAQWCHDAPLALPLDQFPGTTREEQKKIAVRTLNERLKKKFSQERFEREIEAPFPFIEEIPHGNEDNANLTEEQIKERNAAIDNNEWHTAIEKIREWTDFDLNASDLDLFLETHSTKVSSGVAEKIRTIQRLFRLTDNPEAINYLIRNGFYSAAKIALVDEERFVAEHGLGLGNKEQASDIHRLAKNFVAEATLDIERYHASLNESDATILSLPRGFQGEQASANSAQTNVARQRLQSKNYANWKTLFGTVNRNSGTENQSILSASAYLLDLLEFLKQGRAYDRFIGRRPDIKDLLMTKANAETSLPTIDLAIELMESLLAKSSVQEKVAPLCNQTPDDATAENLRAVPCRGDPSVSVAGQDVEKLALSALANKCYPMYLPKNLERERVSRILKNLSLDFSTIARKLHKTENASLLLDANQRKTLETSSQESDVPYALWGLEDYGNINVFFPDKSRRIEKATYWYEVLCNLAFVLDRADLTYDEFAEIFKSSVFQNSGAEIKADSEAFQLADVNGYRIHFEDDGSGARRIDFFNRLSVFVRRRKILGWSIAEIADTWDCSVEELADIQELKNRLDLAALEAECLLSPKTDSIENSVLSKNKLQKIFPVSSLFALYAESEETAPTAENIDRLRFQLIATAKTCLKMEAQDALLILDAFWNSDSNDTMANLFKNGLEVLYRYNLWITVNSLSVNDYLFLERIGFPVAFGSREKCNATIDSLELLRNSSLSIGDLAEILEPQQMTLAETASFVLELNVNVRKALSEFAVKEDDYKSAILELLKALDKENAKEVLDAWTSGFEADGRARWSIRLNELLRYVEEPSSSWKHVLASDENGNVFYAALCNELAFERTLALIAEKFSMPSETLADLFEKLKGDSLDDLTEWKNLAGRENFSSVNDEDVLLVEKLCQRIVRCVALYRFTQTLELGFEWNLKNFVSSAENGNTPYKLFENVLYAFAASSQILGEVYSYHKLSALGASDEKLQISEDAFVALLDEAGIDFERDENSHLVISLDINSPAAWYKFADALYLYRKTNTLPNGLLRLLNTDDASYAEYADTFEKNLRQVRSDAEWNGFIRNVNDEIRQLKRDALSAVVCNESQMPDTASYYPAVFVDANDIYSYYLLDVKMEPDMAISRTVQAVSSVQLYVERALMGVEDDYTLNDTQKEQWDWMKNFQVWVANRKVFLYPENWIDGDLRADKTPFFVELEDRLAEIGDDRDAMDEALGEYLKKVCDTSEMDIVGACKQDGGSSAGVLYTLHIVGRTRGEPHTYYYRKYEATALYGGSYSPWEEVPLEIEGSSIQPAILGGHPYITWLQVVPGQRQKKTGESGGKQATVSVEYYAEIRLKWASFTGAKWTGVKVGKQAVYDVSENQLDFILGENEDLADRYFVIDVSDNSDTLNLQLFRTFPDFVDTPRVVTVPVANSSPMSGNAESLDSAPATTYILKTEISREYGSDQRINHVGDFSLSKDGSDAAENQVDPETGDPIAFTYGEFVKDHSPQGCRLVGNMFHSAGGSLVLLDGTKIFGNTRGPFKLLSVDMGFIRHEDRPFFYMDSKGTFLVRTVSGDNGTGANSIPNYYIEMISNPQAGEFHRRFLDGGTKWLYSRETEALPVSDSYYYSYSYYNYYFSVYLGYYTAGDWQAWDLSQTLFAHSYLPGSVVAEPYPSATVDFCWGSANSVYNWELFFFVPMLLADRMLAEQNYESALNWLQLVFDPRTGLTSYERTKRFVRELPAGVKYWKFLPFFANQDADRSILSELSFPTPHDDLPDRKAVRLLIDRWKNDPFNPQLIARYRPVAYQKYVVMKYLDALIGRGDQLFTQDTTESINLAVQMYILAAEILGPKSAEVPDPKTDAAFSVKKLLEYGNGVLNNAFVTYEDTMLSGRCREKETPQRLLPGSTMQLASTTGMMFYFNVPRNEILMGYWETVADRLYKIRNSLNIDGVKRALSLFAPPIDPALLVKAKASGVSISEVLSDASSALPYYRFKVMVKKAIEIVRDLMQTGQHLMDALEKYDAESLALLRVSHEKTMLALQKSITDMDVTELEKELESVETEAESIETEQAEQEEYLKPIKLEEQYDKLMEKVGKVQETVEKIRNAASVAAKLPDLDVGAIANGLGGPSFSSFASGGSKIAQRLVNDAEGYASRFVQRQISAAKIKLQAEAERKLQSWTMQKTEKANQAKALEKKKVIAEIKIDYAKKQVDKTEREVELKNEMYEHLSEKYTNRELYEWLKKETGDVYKSLFRLAVRVARKAEKCYHFEIGDEEDESMTAQNFIKGSGSYWDNLHGGLLAGEKLLADLHTMEVAYLENDRNELEITRPVSLWELENRQGTDDLANTQTPLTDLKEGKECLFEIPKTLYDKDFPLQYFRRIRDIRIEILAPNYRGHYLNAELTLTNNELDLGITEKTVKNRIGTQTMATSTAHQESGKYNFCFCSDKFSPFDGAGAISKWTLKITGFDNSRNNIEGTNHRLDLSKIEDVIVYVSYTARMGKTQGEKTNV